MKVLLDTNIVIHREKNQVTEESIGILFNWLDKLGYQKCIIPATLQELGNYYDPKTILLKAKSYTELKTVAPETPEIQAIRQKFDRKPNDTIDTDLLKEVFAGRVDLLLTQDNGIHKKAQALGIAERVFNIDSFLEKVVAENPDLANYKVLAVKKELFGNINLTDPFFNSFKADYAGFEKWFTKKAEETAYICTGEHDAILAFLYVKRELPGENYTDIQPAFSPKRRLKIGTFKVVANGYKLGERFLKIVFDNALLLKVEEIYVTIFDKTEDQERLIDLMLDWGFRKYGVKDTKDGKEIVLVRDFAPIANTSQPSLSYPYISGKTKKYIVPIYPEYHTELLPDSILRTESPQDFVENDPHRNAISKVYISRSWEKGLKPGDIIVFYRTKTNHHAYYTSVITTIGVVQNVITNIPNFEKFKQLCRKRSVFSDEALKKYWDYYPNSHPFIVNFLYVYSFPKRLNLQELQDSGIIAKAPRGFEPLSDEAFNLLLEKSNADKRIIVY